MILFEVDLLNTDDVGLCLGFMLKHADLADYTDFADLYISLSVLLV